MAKEWLMLEKIKYACKNIYTKLEIFIEQTEEMSKPTRSALYLS